MKITRVLPFPVVLLATVAGAENAYALSCSEIMNMVNVNVPTNIVVQTIKDSGEAFSADEVRCLTNEGAPAEVVAAAKATMSSGAPADEETPVPATNTKAKGSSSSFENDSEIGDDTKSSGRELKDEGEEETGRDPEKLEDAITAYNAKKYLTASLLLYELYESKEAGDKETKVLYYLAQSLYQLQMYHSAQYFYIEVLKKGTGTPYFKYALPRLVTISRFTGDESDLMRIVAKIPPEEYPRSAKNQLYYLLGVKSYEDNKLKEARDYFEQVSEQSDLYTRAQYLEGVIYNKQGKLKSAVKSFNAVAKTKGEAVTAQELDELNNLRDLSLMNIARIYYGIEQFDNAATYYGLVPKTSQYWPQTMFESAWTNFMRTDLNLTLGQLLTIQSPYYAEHEFIPEAPILKALAFFQLCKFDDIKRVMIDFDATYRPIHEELKLFLQQYSTDEGRKLSDQAYDHYFGDSPKDTVLPKSLFVRLLRDQEFAGLVSHLEMMDRERALIESQKTQWKDSVGTYLLKVMAEDEEKLKRRAGNAMLREMASLTTYLGDLLTQAEIIKFEVADQDRQRLTALSQGVELNATGDTTIDYATTPDKIFWPFNGEFWSDELGYYRFTEKTSCKQD